MITNLLNFSFSLSFLKFRTRHSSRNERDRGAETSRSTRYRNRSRSRSPLRRLETSRHNSVSKDLQSNTRLRGSNSDERERSTGTIYSNTRNIPMHLDGSSHSKHIGEGHTSELGQIYL